MSHKPKNGFVCSYVRGQGIGRSGWLGPLPLSCWIIMSLEPGQIMNLVLVRNISPLKISAIHES
jgi:hypothetical protein